MNGGMLRCINLLNQVSTYFDVTAIIHQDKGSFLRATEEYPALKNVTVFSTADQHPPIDVFTLLPAKARTALRYRYWNRSFKGPADGNFLSIYPVLTRVLKKEKFDYVILEDMTILNTIKVIRRNLPEAKVIYDAYNVNTTLAKTAFNSKQIPQWEYELTKKIESNLDGLIDYIFTCSELDLEVLKSMNNGKLKGVVIPNGATIPANSFSHAENHQSGPSKILFCGSMDYLPNQEGLLWFCKKVLPLIVKEEPSLQLMVVGKGQPDVELLQLLAHKNIINYGMVERVSDYYEKAQVAIVPLLSGSGTRLKLLEAMGYKVPVVSTSVGAEGIAYTNQKDILIADDEVSFAKNVIELTRNSVVANHIAQQAFSFIKETYDWNIIGKKLYYFLLGSSKS